MSQACRHLKLSRQAVYQQERRSVQSQKGDSEVLPLIHYWRALMPRLGTRKLHYLLQPQLADKGIKLGRDRLFSQLRAQGMLVKPKRRFTKTTYTYSWMRKHPNLFSGQVIERPEQALVSDITYVESGEGVHYLSLVTDAYSRKIMGHELSWRMRASDTVKALHRAAAQRITSEPLIHHSDRGTQYCSALYQQALAKHDIEPSMTDGYDCYQNAMAERVNGILKQEFLLYRCQTFDELKQLIDESVETYNEVRPHLSLGMRTPDEVHKKASC